MTSRYIAYRQTWNAETETVGIDQTAILCQADGPAEMSGLISALQAEHCIAVLDTVTGLVALDGRGTVPLSEL